MKIRLGFVSNSSSSSYIVTWKNIKNGSTQPLYRIVADMMGIYDECFDETLNKFVSDGKTSINESFDDANYILNHTTLIYDNEMEIYETSGDTTMMNSYADYPQALAYFVLGLAAEGLIISVKEDNDG